MGRMLPPAQLPNGFGTAGGTLWLPSREGLKDSGNALDEDDIVEVAYSHIEPRGSHFHNAMARFHPIPNVFDEVATRVYSPSDPWESEPWNGGSGYGASAYGATLTFGPALGGDWGISAEANWFGFLAISEDPSDVVTWTGPGSWSEVSPYSYSLSGYGSFHYVFHRFASGSTTNVVATFASGAGTIKAAGYIRILKKSGSASSLTPTVDAEIGTVVPTATQRPGISLTEPVAATTGILVVSAFRGPPGYDPADSHVRPDVEFLGGKAQSSKIPMYRIDGRKYSVVRTIGGLGEPGRAAAVRGEIQRSGSSSSVSITSGAMNATTTLLAHNVIGSEVGVDCDIVASPTRIIVKETGLYLVQVSFVDSDTGSTDYGFALGFGYNGTGAVWSPIQNVRRVLGGLSVYRASALFQMNKGDYITQVVGQNSGSTKTGTYLATLSVALIPG